MVCFINFIFILPIFTSNKKKTSISQKIFTSIILRNRAYAVLNILYNKFIKNRVKIVPIDIFYLLIEVGLVFWIMCDGYLTTKNGLVICTDIFTIIDVVRLMNILLIKWNIKSTINYNNGKSRIYISRLETLKTIELIKSYVCSHFYYKIS